MGRNKKRILALAAVLLCVLAALAFRTINEKSSPVETLEESITCLDGTLSFTIPEAYDSSWYLQISGRLETESGGMSVHYLEEISREGSWKKNETYSFRTEEGSYSELILYVSTGKEEADIDLLSYLPKR